MSGGDTGRYAIYLAPEPSSGLARFGAEWLGYDAITGACLTRPVVEGIAPHRLREITTEPRHYGFHATLKPPFALAAGTDPGGLDAAIVALAQSFAAFVAPPLRLACLSGFWALMLSNRCAEMKRLAALCVAELDHFRAPASPPELARRRSADLSPAQETLLARWGYPYVMEEFRFHMTLTARLDAEEGAAVGRALAPVVEPLCQTTLRIDAISLFRQDRRDIPFRLLRRYALAG